MVFFSFEDRRQYLDMRSRNNHSSRLSRQKKRDEAEEVKTRALSLSARCDEYSAKIASMQAEMERVVTAKDAKIADLQSQVTRLTTDNESKASMLKSVQHEKVKLEKQVEDLTDQLSHVMSEPKAPDVEEPTTAVNPTVAAETRCVWNARDEDISNLLEDGPLFAKEFEKQADENHYFGFNEK